MSLLSICDAAVRLLQFARRTGLALQRRANWTSLVTEYLFEAEGSSDFTLPADFGRIIDDTLWDRTRFWRMRGALSPQQWQLYKSSIIGRATIERRWRIRLPGGAVAGAPTVFSIDPPLSTIPGGEQFVFEYVSANWVRSVSPPYSLQSPSVANGGTGYALGDQFTVLGGTSTVPAVGEITELASSGTGVVSRFEIITPGNYTVVPSSPASTSALLGAGSGLTIVTTAATMFGVTAPDWTADTDVALIDENLIELGVIWRLLARLGLAYAEEKDEYEREVDKAVARDGGNAILDLAPWDRLTLVGPYNVQEGNFPGSANAP